MKSLNKITLLLIFFLMNSIAFATPSNPKQVKINGFVIDVTQAETVDTSKEAVKNKDKPKKWIVQFTGPIHDADKIQLLNTGCRIDAYIPEFAFITTMDDNTKKKLETLPFIEGIVRYRPEHKIERRLQDKIERKEITSIHVRADSADNLQVLLSAVLKKKRRNPECGPRCSKSTG